MIRWVRARLRKGFVSTLKRVPRWLRWLGASEQVVWKAALPEEVLFFDRRLADPGRWFPGYDDPAVPLQEEYRELLAGCPEPVVRILDVGAGPLTAVGPFWEGRRVEITASDALADAYGESLRKHGIHPRVWPVQAEAERLADRFGEGAFDLVVANNSIDHCYDALAAIRSMVAVTRDGGHVFLLHNVNEATNRRNTGMHQWDFDGPYGRFVIRNGKVVHDVTALLSPACRVETTLLEGDRVKVVIRKGAGAPAAG